MISVSEQHVNLLPYRGHTQRPRTQIDTLSDTFLVTYNLLIVLFCIYKLLLEA